MSSEFTDRYDAAEAAEGWSEQLDVASERYRFYKVRIFGVLQLLKTPAPAYLHDMLTLESLRKEFSICYGLNNPGIPRYYKFEDKKLYEEYIDGVTLRHLIDTKDARLSSRDFRNSLARQLLETVAYLHSHGIVHRDIKPENIMVTHLGDRLKIIDFGAAESAACDSTPGFTEGCLAPEQTSGAADFQTDIYQCGLALRALGRHPKDGKDWQKFIASLTASDRSKRFKTCEEALKSLPERRKSGKSTWVIILAAIILAAGAVLLSSLYLTKTGVDTRAVKKETADSAAVLAADNVTAPKKDTVYVVTQQETASEAVNAVAPKAAKSESQTERLQSKIQKKVEAIFENIVHSGARKLEPDAKTGKLGGENLKEYFRLIDVAYNEAVAYGNKLSTEYPDQRILIDNTVRQTSEYCLGRLHSIYYY